MHLIARRLLIYADARLWMALKANNRILNVCAPAPVAGVIHKIHAGVIEENFMVPIASQ